MRNLKKILALVLALVMSLSLMATAGAADFSDKDQISDKYSDAVTVLNGLEVFKGYDNGARFEPQGNITRAEVAAIIYRIATGDVTDTQKDIYSTWGLFTDVADGSWYAGYVNYCANAGYIKGRGNKIFDPNGKVTGYEALAMILRAIGYDKNNEFSGSNWQVNTASIAKQRGITNNITDTLLGQAATREVVAEILFQAILVPTVTFNTATISYTNNATSLGKDVLNLDKVTGVVVANEFANVQDDDLKVLAEGKTQLRVAAGDVRTLDLGTDLNDIGMSENAYIQGSKVLLISEADNTVFDNTDKNGEHVDIGSSSKFSDVTSLSKNDDTEFFVNFDHSTEHKANRRIELRVTFRDAQAEAEFDNYATDISKVAAENGYTLRLVNTNTNLTTNGSDFADLYGASNYPVEYVKVFKVEDPLTDDDLAVLKGIFGMADDEEGTTWGVSGSVYVGTSSQSGDDVRWTTNDKSNTMSYRAFKEEYIDTDLIKNWSTSNDGEWVKVIDNNGDGVAEYAFKTAFNLDKAVNTYTKNDESTLRYYNLDLINDDYTGRYMNTVAEGDIVLHTVIDGQALIWKANTVEDTITKINDIYKRSVTATTSSGDVYSQSEIYNNTRLDDRIDQMSETVNYRMYLDAFGRIRAYEPVDGNKYALITEMYYGNYRNNRYVVNDILTAEMKAGDAGLTERVVNNPINNDFLLNVSNIANTTLRNNWADLNTIMMGLRDSGVAADYVENLYSTVGLWPSFSDLVDANNTNWAKNVVLQPATGSLGFLNGPVNARDIFRNATTNIARYVVNADGTVNLSTAAQLGYGSDGRLTGNYAVNYVELNESSVSAKQNVYKALNAGDGFNGRVDANNETEYYIVANGNVEHFVGYSKLPKVTDIRSMYTVARNTSTDKDNQRYWVAEVVVIESDTYTAQPDDYLFILGRADNIGADSLSNSRMAAGSQYLYAISAKAEGTIRVTPANLSWGVSTVTPGMYKAYGITEQADGTYTVDRLSNRIDPKNVNNVNYPNDVNTSSFKLRAGTVIKNAGMNDRYEVRINGTNDYEQVTFRGPSLGILQNRSNNITVSDRMNGDHWSNLVTLGNDILWVEDGSGNALFTIDVTYSTKESTYKDGIIATLNTIYDGVVVSQGNKVTAKDYTVTVEFTGADAKHPVSAIKYPVAARDDVTLTAADLVKKLSGTYSVDLENAVILNTADGLNAANNGVYGIAQDANAIVLTKITANLTVKVPVTLATGATVKLANNWTDGTVKVSSGCVTTAQTITNTRGYNFHAGDTVKVVVTANTTNAASWYSLKIGDKDPITNRTGVFTFVMDTEDVSLTVGYGYQAFDVKFENADGITVKAENKSDKAPQAIPGVDYKFSAVPSAGVALKKVEYSINGGALKEFTNANYAADVYTINLDTNATSLTVKFTTELKELSFTLQVNNGAPAVQMGGETVTGSRTVKTNMSQTITFTVADAADVTVSSGDCLVNYVPSGTNGRTYIVSNITENTVIAVSAK